MTSLNAKCYNHPNSMFSTPSSRGTNMGNKVYPQNIMSGTNQLYGVENEELSELYEENKLNTRDFTTSLLSFKSILKIIERPTMQIPVRNLPSHSVYLQTQGLKQMDPNLYNLMNEIEGNNGRVMNVGSAYSFTEFIQIPVRGKKCLHVDVFDLAFFIHRTGFLKWKCPVCMKDLRLVHLIRDEIMVAALRIKQPNDDFICINIVR
jgi:hypothetical protein